MRYLLFLFLPIFVFASAHSESAEGGTDFWWRLFNFLIFAIIIYRLVYGKIVDFFKSRESSIASELSAIEEKLKEAKTQKAQAFQRVKDAEKSADELITVAEEEAKIVAEKIAQDLEQEKLHLEKSYQDRIEIETKRMKEKVVSEVIEEMFSSKDMSISNDDLLNIIKEKVA